MDSLVVSGCVSVVKSASQTRKRNRAARVFADARGSRKIVRWGATGGGWGGVLRAASAGEHIGRAASESQPHSSIH